MKTVTPITFLAYFLIFIIILNLIFLIVGWINPFWFFMIAIVVGLIAYKGIPWMRKR